MDQTQEAGEVFLNALGLLGVPVAQAARDYGCEIRQNMFTQTNQKGLNAMLHLLFERIKGRESLRKELKGIWPVKDLGAQREFNKAIHKLVTALSQQGYMPKHLAASLLQCFRQLSGSRITAVLCFLAAYALLQTDPSAGQAKYTFQELPTNSAALEILYRSLRAQTTAERARFIACLHRLSKCQTEWTATVDKLGHQYQQHGNEIGQQLKVPQAEAESQEAEEASSPGEAPDSVQPTDAELQQAELLEAVPKAEELWGHVLASAAKQKGLKQALESVVAASKHPFEINGDKLQQRCLDGSQGTVKAACVDIRHLLQDWQKLIKNIDTAIPSMEQIHASERLGREVAPLLDATQQKQICSMGMQHHARLTAQKQLSTTLQQALTSAVKRREALQAQLMPGMRRKGPVSPCHKDLIPASYPGRQDPADMQADTPSCMDPLLLKKTGRAAEDNVLSASQKGQQGIPKAASAPTRAEMSAPAASCSFPSAIQLLGPYRATSDDSVVNALPSSPKNNTHFLLPDDEHEAKVSACMLDMACRGYIENEWQAQGKDSFAPSNVKIQVSKEDTPASMKPASPRRLSFSGASPTDGFGQNETTDTNQSGMESKCSNETESATVDAVAEMIARMNRLNQAA